MVALSFDRTQCRFCVVRSPYGSKLKPCKGIAQKTYGFDPLAGDTSKSLKPVYTQGGNPRRFAAIGNVHPGSGAILRRLAALANAYQDKERAPGQSLSTKAHAE